MLADKTTILAAIHDTGGTVSNGVVRGGNLAKVARKLGVARKTLHNRMVAFGWRGLSGRPRKKSYGKRSRNYAVAATAVAVVVGGALLYSNRGTSV